MDVFTAFLKQHLKVYAAGRLDGAVALGEGVIEMMGGSA